MPAGTTCTLQRDQGQVDAGRGGVQRAELNLLTGRPQVESKMAQTLQSDCPVGVKVKLGSATHADFYTKYLEVPSVAKRGVWDLSLPAGVRTGTATRRSRSSGRCSTARPTRPTSATSASSTTHGEQPDRQGPWRLDQRGRDLWAQADEEVMKQAAIYPIADPNQPTYHARQVHNAVFIRPSRTSIRPTCG